MFGLTLSALEYPVLKCCFAASPSACSAPAASDAPGTLTATKGSVFSLFGGGRIAIIFSVGRPVFSTVKKKKSVFFLLVIFSTSQAEPKGVSKERPGTSLPLRARRPSGHTGPLVPQRDGNEDSSCPRAQSQRPNARSCSRNPKEGGYT